MDHKAKFTEVIQTIWVKPEGHVDLVISSEGHDQPQENRIFRFLKINVKIAPISYLTPIRKKRVTEDQLFFLLFSNENTL